MFSGVIYEVWLIFSCKLTIYILPYAESMAELLDLIQNHTLWCTSESKQESLSRVDPLVPLIDHDLSDLGSLIQIWIMWEKCSPYEHGHIHVE